MGFGGGEISPELYARTDLDKHAKSLRTCLNMIATQRGALVNRPGTLYVGSTKDSSKRARLIPFIFSGDQTFVLEFGDLYVRFYTAGAGAAETWSPTITYAANDYVIYSGAIYKAIAGANLNHPPVNSSRWWRKVLPGLLSPSGSPAYNGATTYVKDDYVTYSSVTYRSIANGNVGNQPDVSPAQWTATTIYELITPYAYTDLPRLKYAQSGDEIIFTHPNYVERKLTRLSNIHWTIAPFSVSRSLLAADLVSGTINNFDNGDGERPWFYVITSISATGEESLLDYAKSDGRTFIRLAGNKVPALTWPAVTGASSYNIYVGLNKEFGYIGNSSTNAFYDDFRAPDFTRPPPRGDTPAYSTAVAYHNQRLCFGGRNINSVGAVPAEPERIQMSAVGDYKNFDETDVPTDSHAVDLTLATRRLEEIRALVPLRTLVVLTANSEWTVSGSQEGPVSPLDVDARPHSWHGTSWLDPLVIGNVALFVQQKGDIVRELAFDLRSGGYVGNDLSALAYHLFQGHTIKEWCYAGTPYSVVWAVRDDGVLLGLSYVRDQDVWAWHRHVTDGVVESVCSVPEGGEDAVYMIVQRTINGSTTRYVERMQSRQVSDIKFAWFVDCGLSFDGTNRTFIAHMHTSTSAAVSAGDTVTIIASLSTFSPGDVGDTVILLAGTATPIAFRVISYTNGFNVDAEAVTAVDASTMADCATVSEDWAWARDHFSGLDHLEGKSVIVLADGSVQGPYTVASGAIDIDTPARYAQIGLPYTSDLETLELAVQGAELRSVTKNVFRASFEVYASRGIFAGETLDDLTEWKSRGVVDAYDATSPKTTLVEVNIKNTWNKGGRVALRQSAPLPLTVLSVIREVEIGRP